MSTRRGLLRQVAAILVLLGALAGAGLHHHEDFATSVGAPGPRVLSGHSPLSHSAHWHSAVVVTDDPCLACQSQRTAGIAAEPCREVPVTVAHVGGRVSAPSTVSRDVASHGSRAPPALL